MYRIIHYAVPAIAGPAGGLRKQYLKMGDQKRYKELKMQDVKMRDHRVMTGNWRTGCRKRLHNVISG